MNKIGSYRRLGAWAVLLVFLAGWSMGSLHQLLSHHRHSAQLECRVEAEHDPNVAHIHDERYANEQCSLCAFVLSTPELLSITSVLPRLSEIPDSSDSFPCTPSCTGTIHDTTCLRGPPVM